MTQGRPLGKRGWSESGGSTPAIAALTGADVPPAEMLSLNRWIFPSKTGGRGEVGTRGKAKVFPLGGTRPRVGMKATMEPGPCA